VTQRQPGPLADCWAWDLRLADGGEPGLIETPALLAGCDEPHAFELWLDYTVWSTGYVILCQAHTARIRALPYGGIVCITTTTASAC
jgi:hypothetical protein